MEHTIKKYKIGAVVVLYNPKAELLIRCIDTLTMQVSEICIIDNSSKDNLEILKSRNNNITYKPMKRNIGIASAQNIGIRYFKNRNFDFILFSDQDSESPHDLVHKLLNSYLSLKDKINISAIGPMPINRNTGTPYIYQQCIIEKSKFNDIGFYKMHSIISSYSLIPIKNFESVGMMSERLFIDFVDQEWCWRAKHEQDMTCVLMPGITIQHELGVSKKFLGRQISVSSPFRIYFQTRNLLWLTKTKYAPTYWKRMNIIKLFPKIIYYSLFSNNKTTYLKRIAKGIHDGLKNNI